MFGFQRNKITPASNPQQRLQKKLLIILGAVLMIFFILHGVIRISDELRSTRLMQIVSQFFGKDLVQDEQGHTNILLLGVGGEEHEGGTLTDTVLVASIDHVNNRIGLISIPRDLYAEWTIGSFRVNELYENAQRKWNEGEGIDFARSAMEKILAVPIPYVLKMDFTAVKETVDAVGGIDVVVPHAIYDPLYPKDGTYEYETFSIGSGEQHMDGATALKYVRSRKTSSDFDRSKRQHQVLIAIKEKARSILRRPSKLKDLYFSLSDHVSTNMTIREVVALSRFASHWDSSLLSTGTLNDEPLLPGGFLYVPLRSAYGGAYVLRPAGEDFIHIQKYVRLLMYSPPGLEQYSVTILNGTKRNGFAGKARAILNRYGITIDKTGNARDNALKTTRWYVQSPESEAVAKNLQTIIPGDIVNELPPEYSEYEQSPQIIILEIGDEGLAAIESADIFRNIVPLVPTPTSAEVAGSSTPSL